MEHKKIKMIRQGIILTGGSGTRLLPFTSIASKQLFPIGEKFVIDYPLNTLKQLGVKDLIVVLGGPFFQQVVQYIGDGKELGFDNVVYLYQSSPDGISQAIALCENIIKDEQFYVILGDNIFDNNIDINNIDQYGSIINIIKHKDLNRFGVASIKNNKIIKIDEKPKLINNEYENYAISGLYLFDYNFFSFYKQTKKSDRNEYEITDIIKKYLDNNNLGYNIINGLWRDAGTFDSIYDLTEYFRNKYAI